MSQLLCVLLALAAVTAEITYTDLGKTVEWATNGYHTMNVIKMSEVVPIIHDLSEKEAEANKAAEAIDDENSELEPGAEPGTAGTKLIPKSPNQGLYAFNTCVKYNEDKTKEAHTAAKHEYNAKHLKFASFDVFKVVNGHGDPKKNYLKIGWVTFNIEYQEIVKKKKKKKGTKTGVKTVKFTIPVIPTMEPVSAESGIDGEMIAHAFNYRMNEQPPNQLNAAIKRKETYQVLVCIIVGYENRKKYKEPHLVQFRTSPVQLRGWVSGFSGHVYAVHVTSSAHIAPYNEQGFVGRENYYDMADDYQYSNSVPIIGNNSFWVLTVLNLFTICNIMVCITGISCCFCGLVVYYKYNELQGKEVDHSNVELQV